MFGFQKERTSMVFSDLAHLTVYVLMIAVEENTLSKIWSELQTAAMKLHDYNLTTEAAGFFIHFYVLLETRNQW